MNFLNLKFILFGDRADVHEPLGVIVDYLSFSVYRGILYHSTQNFVSYLNIILDYLLATRITT